MPDITATSVTKSDIEFLKVAGVATMLVDHIGYLFFYDDIIPRLIGRMAYPIFAYCLVVGFIHTESLKKYATRLVVTGLLSQPIYVWVFGLHWFNPNILFTMAIGLASLMFIQQRQWLAYVVTLCASFLLNIDFGLNGILLIAVFFLVRNARHPGWLVAGFLFLSFFFDLTSLLNQRIPLHDLGEPLKYNFNALGIIAIPLIFVKKPKLNWQIPSIFFYLFYPSHLLLLKLIKIF